jgi:hypothetical protein
LKYPGWYGDINRNESVVGNADRSVPFDIEIGKGNKKFGCGI